MTQRQTLAMNMILDVAAWLNGSDEAAEKSKQPDVIIRHACFEGAKRLESITEYLSNGKMPTWYGDEDDDEDLLDDFDDDEELLDDQEAGADQYDDTGDQNMDQAE